MLEVTSQLAQCARIDAMALRLRVAGFDISCTERHSHQTFSVLLEVGIEMHRESLGIDNATLQHIHITDRAGMIDALNAVMRRHCAHSHLDK